MADNLLNSFLPDDRASFGIFPQMKPRRRLQDPEGAANVPLDVLRGRFAGLAGLLPDTLNFMGRSPMPTEMFGETQYEPTQQLPYGSEYFLQNLPLKPTSRIGEVAGQAGAFVPLNPMPAARALAAGARALGPTAVRMGEGYLQRQGLMPGVVPEVPGMPATPLASMIEKPQAPVSPLGFYSAAEQAALNLQRGKGTGQSFLNDLMKAPDVKKDELQYTGLYDFLANKPNVTRQEVQDFIASNRVDVQEVTYGKQDFSKLPDTQLQDEYVRVRGYKPVDNYGGAMSREQIISELSGAQADDLTKHSRYQLSGGENYREILLKLPQKETRTPNMIEFQKLGQKMFAGALNPTEKARLDELRNLLSMEEKYVAVGLGKSGTSVYQSTHFDEPNILAHMRVNDRLDADGKKMLLVEEIQSDWHQAGREKGYTTPEKLAAEQKKIDDLLLERQQLLERHKQLKELALPFTSQGKDAPTNILDELNSVSQRLNRLQIEQNRLSIFRDTGVPDAPFKDTWYQLSLKRLLKYAADNGYERVGLTTGKQQINRFSDELRQNVDELQFFPIGNQNNILISAKKGGKQTFRGTVADNKFIDGPASGKTVEEVLGKSIAKQIVEKKDGIIKGDDLTIGGEGMKAYYDEIYPAFLAKQGKKYNAKTGETRIKTGNAYAQTKGIPAEQSIRYIDISPEMRSSVKKGQPLFTAAPIGGIGLGAGTQDNEMPDAVRQYMADPRYSDPFADTTR